MCSAVKQSTSADRSLDSFAFSNGVTIAYDQNGSSLDSITAHLFSQDLEKLSGIKPKVTTEIPAEGNVIIIGSINSELVRSIIPKGSKDLINLDGQWERFIIKAVAKENSNRNTLIIIGSDDRGTAFGVFEVSRLLGVSPWHWWADVPVKENQNPVLLDLPIVSQTPTVKYRGIFINDEDWGLQPWAAKTFEPGTGDIGPKTYEKVFELLLRLKANLIWPAMHPSTKAFFHYSGNVAMAKDYQIIIGSSHAEPMLRNNVDEWDKATRGAFNYLTNREGVQTYWEERVKESTGLHGIYTLGMRGIHDSGMEGVTDTEAVEVLQRVIEDQREMLGRHLDRVEEVPQAFTAYKEVLDVYDRGLRVPDDVILVWPDDNYGYIKRLANADEQARKGGSGVYYHTSYWGRPHDYLWLNSTHPSLIRYEMMKAYERESRELWVLNVGDIKPHEYNIQLFLDMAFDAETFKDSKSTKLHFTQWHQGVFGTELGKILSEAMWKYYDLAFERKPEFMGWSQTEPTRPIQNTAYNHRGRGDEAQKRLEAYDEIELAVNVENISNELFPAYYQLVYYPIKAASLINKKFIYRDKALLYSQENRLSAYKFKDKSHQTYQDIIKETKYFNDELLDGKWMHMMDMAPRRLPVFEDPKIDLVGDQRTDKMMAINVEGSIGSDQIPSLPPFNSWNRTKQFIDVFLTSHSNQETHQWQASASHDWIRISDSRGSFTKDRDTEKRIWVEIDWDKLNETGKTHEGKVTIQTPKQNYEVGILAQNRPTINEQITLVENNHLVVINAANYSSKNGSNKLRWEKVEDLGHTGSVMESGPIHMLTEVSEAIGDTNPTLHYDFYTYNETDQSRVIINALPTHPLTDQYKLRIGISLDDGPVQIVDFKTEGRSEEWKQNVLRNKASKEVGIGTLASGKHTLKIYMIDPGVLLDFIYIDMGGLDEGVSVLEETRIGE